MASDITELLLKLLHRNYLNNMCVTCVCYITYISTNMDKLLTCGLGEHYLLKCRNFWLFIIAIHLVLIVLLCNRTLLLSVAK
jgi:amino acid permease